MTEPEWIDGAAKDAMGPPDPPIIRGGQGRSATIITISSIVMMVAIFIVACVLLWELLTI